MNKDEFIRELTSRLYSLPKEEKDSAIRYYQELFDEAGPEGEAGVISGLGSPKEAADSILNDYYGKNPEEAKKIIVKKTPIWLIAILVILALPMVVAVGGALFGVVVGILGAALGITVAAGAVVLALVLSGIAVLITGIAMLFVHVALGFMLIGIGLILAGFGMLLVIPFCAFFAKLVPAVVVGIVNVGKRIFNRRGNLNGQPV